MKKILAIFSLVSFLAVNVSIAKDPATASAAKTESVAKTTDAKASMPACCKGKTAKDCSAEMKGYTPEQKAACMKSCTGDKAKADAGTKVDAGTVKKNGTK